MADRKATASWKGTAKDGSGRIAVGSGLFEGSFSFATRMENEPGTNPEELLGASLAGCYTMALNAALERDGKPAKSVRSEAIVHLGKDDAGFVIKGIDLETEADVEGINAEDFSQLAENVKHACPIGRALASVPITLKASLANG